MSDSEDETFDLADSFEGKEDNVDATCPSQAIPVCIECTDEPGMTLEGFSANMKLAEQLEQQVQILRKVRVYTYN